MNKKSISLTYQFFKLFTFIIKYLVTNINLSIKSVNKIFLVCTILL